MAESNPIADYPWVSQIRQNLGERFALPRVEHESYGEIGELTDRIVAEFVTRPAGYMRGVTTVMSYRMHGGRNIEIPLQAAVAAEAWQSAFLIMDDNMDDATERRGGPTLNVQYSDYLAEKSAARRQQGLMAGRPNLAKIGNDLAYNAAAEIGQEADIVFLEIPEELALVVKALILFKESMKVAARGQAQDVVGGVFGFDTAEEILRMNAQKTGYSFVAPMQVGACLAGAPDAVLRDYGVAGYKAAQAFQLIDDDLGIFGEEAVTGKSVTSDIGKNKATLLMWHSLNHATESDKRILRSILGNGAVTPSQHQLVQEILIRTGSRDYAKQVAYQAVLDAGEIMQQHAEAAWAQTPHGQEGFAFFRSLMSYILVREK